MKVGMLVGIGILSFASWSAGAGLASAVSEADEKDKSKGNDSAISRRSRTFASIFSAEARREGNVALSPAGIGLVLRILQNTANGKTAQDIEALIGPDSEVDSPSSPPSPAEQPTTRVAVAAAVWIADDVSVRPDFQKSVKARFGAAVDSLPFSTEPSKAIRRINDWVADATAGAVRELYKEGEITARSRLIVTSAVAFRANWAAPFPKKFTTDGKFAVSADKQVPVPLMHQVGDFPFAEDAGMQYLELPYTDARYCMIIVLPRPTVSIHDAGQRLFSADIAGSGLDLTTTSVDVTIPRFSIRHKTDLTTSLSSLGLRTLFSEAANLSRIAEPVGQPLYISGILQEALIKVDEAGSLASAGTGAVAEITSAKPVGSPKVFKADRPFVFGILDREKKQLLFAGCLLNPDY